MTEQLLNSLCCVDCRAPLAGSDGYLFCQKCQKKYPIIDQAVFFIVDIAKPDYSKINDSLILKLKEIFKPHQKLYNLLVPIAGALFVGDKKSGYLLTLLPDKALVINLGSGPKIISDKIINVDSFQYKGVSVIADATALPFGDSSIDGVIIESVLEHVKEPRRVISEIKRVLKKGGLIYASIPFVDPYHSSPDDYYRWTMSGFRHLLSDFDEKELAIGWGPTSCFVSVTSHWLGIVLSFGSGAIYQITALFFSCLLSPLKLLDYIFKYYKFSSNLAVGLYFIGAKK